MSRLLSVGLDVGTTSTQMVLSELIVQNRASGFGVPELEISERKVLYKSPVHFTPLLKGDLVDGGEIRRIVEEEYKNAGISRDQVDTGAIIITGETSRRENARRVLTELSGFAGDFVVATAGPELESILAAKGAGAVEDSARTGKTVLHMDIGGGTSNLALIEDGIITKTGCLNVGGRLVKMDPEGNVIYLSPVVADLWDRETADPAQACRKLAQMLVQALEMAAGLREATPLLEKLWTRETGTPARPLADMGTDLVISFSGGVADCIDHRHPWLEFGDLGPVLGQAIRQSRLCRGAYLLGAETIRATVIGAGCHSARLSGSTIFCRNVPLPLKNLPVISVPEGNLPEFLRERGKPEEETPVFFLPGMGASHYGQVADLAEKIALGFAEGPVYLAMEQDMAKALGQALALRLGRDAKILCIDRLRLPQNSYLDIGNPIGPALPVVIKTLVLAKAGEKP